MMMKEHVSNKHMRAFEAKRLKTMNAKFKNSIEGSVQSISIKKELLDEDEEMDIQDDPLDFLVVKQEPADNDD